MYIVPDVIMSGIITAVELALGTAVTGVVHVHLYTNNLVPTKTNVLGDFTELNTAQVPGYAAADANWWAGVPYRRTDGAWEDPNSLVDPSFVASAAPPVPVVAYGIFLTDSTDAILLGSGAFSSPFTFSLAGDGFTLPGNPALLQGDDLSLTLTFQDMEPA